jgi:hypothetical protein
MPGSACAILPGMVDERWDGDTNGSGIADGSAMVPAVRELADAMAGPTWVTEDPDAHLLPHIRRACDAPGSALTFVSAALQEDGVYVVTLEWQPDEASSPALRSTAFAVIETISEQLTNVVQREEARDAVEFDVATGVSDERSEFPIGHGHLVRLRIVGEAAARLAGT